MKSVAYSKDAIKTLRRMPANVSRTIAGKIQQLAENPDNLANNIKVLKGEAGVFRLRVGDWRVLYSEDGDTLFIVNIATRGSVYD
jgi:mRNA interferase RelE/StbE